MKELMIKAICFTLCVLMILSVVGCNGEEKVINKTRKNEKGISSINTNIYFNIINENVEDLKFPLFNNSLNLSRGGPTSYDEEYLDYKNIIADRFKFSDMVGHESEVSAVRLAELGIIDKSEKFEPDSNLTIENFLIMFFKACKQKVEGIDNVKKLVDKINLFEDLKIDYSTKLTKELMAYILAKANVDVSNINQYEMLLDDYSDIDKAYRPQVLQTIASGIIEITNFKFNPKSFATKAQVADGLYRLINSGARVYPLYNLGNQYSIDKNEYLVKTEYEKNDSGVQFGFFTNYNKQSDAFINAGKLAIDRTGFYKWAQIEKTKGVYTMPNFNNDKSSHKMGNTIINCIDLSANKVTNPSYESPSNIPSFYTQNISDMLTRTAAKQFLYAFVKEMMNQLEGDVILAIDYELDYQQAIYNNAAGWNRAKIFAKWFTEACEVARQAAIVAGAGSRLKLMVIYNNITGTHLRGVSENQWMLDLAQAADLIGIDSYNHYDDMTDPSYTIQNIRFLMNNYSLGKPVYVVENGPGMNPALDTIDPVTGLDQISMSAAYYKNLMRQFRFSLERGEFINANLSGFLIWSYYETGTKSTVTHGVVNDDNTLRNNGKEYIAGIKSIMKQKQFNPSYIVNVSNALKKPVEVKVSSGAKYEKLTYVQNKYSTKDGKASLKIKLKDKGTVFITVNGQVNYSDSSMTDVHTFNITNMRNGLNVIDIYFGSEKTPFTQTVEKILMN